MAGNGQTGPGLSGRPNLNIEQSVENFEGLHQIRPAKRTDSNKQTNASRLSIGQLYKAG
jgi:hypothetical protein